ncbi:IPTL-CTERM sorting domain-containing protein [Paenacidovorax monticola]|uniref:IPTL-CTERM sorting domain-containing protein n=1 Tax=Paenacidovorax monticola TaxID=1926868 RepID=A0A7H0HDX2_9BURK|nr:IPTL-CTERM sorting domain-containing protein [Paenacidovorax monticola]QNP58738.1 IPTL-CTERM sorting domain-containing protein [Paenacidovorax monticola]
MEWFTADDSATAPSDYQQASGTLNWSAGDSSPRTITVLVKGDTAVEPDERFSVFLANASGAILPPGSREGVGTITNDDGGTMPPPGGGAHSVPALSDWGQLALSATLIGAAALRRRLAPRANRPAPRSHA